MVAHSDWRIAALGVRAAWRPGMAATRFASTSAPIATMAMDSVGTVGLGTAAISRANLVQSDLPTTMPTGTPTTVPRSATTDACDATVAASCRRVKPSVFKSARSRRRRRTEVMSVNASAKIAPTASPAARTIGAPPTVR